MHATVRELLGSESDGRPNVAVLYVEMKTWRHDAEHRVLLVVEQDLASDEPAIRGETPRPQFVRNYGDVWSAWTILLRRENAADFRLYAENWKKIVGCLRPLQPFGLLTFAAQVINVFGNRRDIRKDAVERLPIRIVARRRGVTWEPNPADVLKDGN